MMYAAEVDQDGMVLRVIVGDVAWAEANLGGTWLPAGPDDYPGPGWTWDGDSFVSPATEEPVYEEYEGGDL